MMNRTLTCIICPRGCTLEAEINGENVSVSGNFCARGIKYAQDECIHPTRTVTSSVRAKNRIDTMVSVKTAEPIPKENIFDLMKILRDTQVDAPVTIGDIILKDVFGTDIIATKTVI